MDPIFVDPENGDYSLSSNSPARNLGKIDIDGYTFPEIDYSGNPRNRLFRKSQNYWD